MHVAYGRIAGQGKAGSRPFAPRICGRAEKVLDIKALSVVQPGGTRIARGEKTLEIRRWDPGLDPAEDLLIVENGRFLHRDGEEDPDGIALAIVKVAKVRPFLPADMPAACAGSYEPGWLAWELVAVRPIAALRPVRAARGIYRLRLPG